MLLIAIGFFLNHASNAWFSLYKKAAPLTSGTAFGSFFLQAQPFCTPRQPYGIVPIMEIMATKMDAIMASIIMAIIERELAAQEDTASALAAAATV